MDMFTSASSLSDKHRTKEKKPPTDVHAMSGLDACSNDALQVSGAPLRLTPLSRSVLQERDLLVTKLVAEISQLERWLDAQSRTEYARTQPGGVSLLPTIRTLIETRRKLLRSLEHSL